MNKFIIFYFTTFTCFCGSWAQSPAFFVEASALYWQAEEGGLGYAVKSSSSTRLAPHSTVENPHFEWDIGFKAGFGYHIPHDLWDLSLNYISFQTHTDTEKQAKDGEVFFPVWITTSATPPLVASRVKMHWRLHLGLLDLKLSKTWQATPTLSLTPQLAVCMGWIRQKFNLEYSGGNFPSGEDELIRMKNKYWGLGPKAALLTEWKMGKGFALFAEGAATLLFGEFYIHQDEDTIGTKQKLLGLHSIYHASAPILEGTAGIQWQHSFSNNTKALGFNLAWNQLLFFSQNQLLHFLASNPNAHFASNQGDLSLAGLQLNVRLDF